MTTMEARQIALQKAIEVLGAGADPGRVIVVAQKFESYLRGNK